MTRDHYETYNRNRLYRNRKRGLLAGVCAGISDWSGFNLTALRVGVVLLAIPFTAVIIKVDGATRSNVVVTIDDTIVFDVAIALPAPLNISPSFENI